MIRILHVITDLDMGGAEMVLYRLLTARDKRQLSHAVVSLSSSGLVGDRISELGVPVHALGMHPGIPGFHRINALVRLIRSYRPDLIQTWMYHADLLGGLASRRAGSPPVIWGLHHTISGAKALKPSTFMVARLNACLSAAIPCKVVCCSEATRRSHIELGYHSEKMLVIPNGVDPSIYRPDPDARRTVRRALGIDERAPVIGLCARFDPQKDHRNFLQAAGILSRLLPDVQFVLWGKNVDHGNRELGGWLAENGLEQQVRLLGLRMDSPRLMAAVDIATLSSSGEAFPLVLGEAMACEVPCVATDVGDAALLVGPTGLIVPPHSPRDLATAWAELLQMEIGSRQELGRRARQRIVEHYSLAHMSREYEHLYQEIAISFEAAA